MAVVMKESKKPHLGIITDKMDLYFYLKMVAWQRSLSLRSFTLYKKQFASQLYMIDVANSLVVHKWFCNPSKAFWLCIILWTVRVLFSVGHFLTGTILISLIYLDIWCGLWHMDKKIMANFLQKEQTICLCD